MKTHWMTIAMLALGLSACGGEITTNVEPVNVADAPEVVDPAAHAAEVAKAIDAEPDRVAEILAEHGLTEAALEALMYDIAADPDLTEAYEAARAK